MKALRILFLCTEFPPGPGGIGTHAYQLATQLNRLGWSPAVLTAQDYASSAEIDSFNQSQPFPVVRFPSLPTSPLKALQRWTVVRRWIREWKPDVVLATGERMVWVGAAACRNTGIPLVAIGHGTEFGLTSFWEKKLMRWSFGRAATIACVSEYTRKSMLDQGIHPQASCVIPNGADPGRFRVLPPESARRMRTQLGLPGAKLLLTVGNVTDRKGQEVVVRALPHILQECPDTHYLMCGLPTEKKKLTALATSLGVSAHLHFLGRVANDTLVELINTCDVFLMTSRRTASGDFEGYGIAVVEAALCGKPAVVSDSGGLPEVVLPGETGFIAPEGDEKATARAVLSLLSDPHRLQATGEAARQRAAREQTWAHRAREYDRVLRGVLGLARTVPEPLCTEQSSTAR